MPGAAPTDTIVGQFDGTWLQGYNCNCASCAWMIRFVTNGAKHPSGGDLRAHVVDLDTGHPDTKGGTNPSQMVDVAERTYGVHLDVRYGADFDAMWDLQHSGRAAIALSIHYSVISGTQFDACPGFTENHEIVVYKDEVYDPLADGRRHLPLGPQKWGKALVKKAAGALNVDGRPGHYTALGFGKAYVYIGYAPKVDPIPVPVPHPTPDVTFRYGGEPRSRGPYGVKKGIGAARIRTAPNPTSKRLAVGTHLIPPGEITATVLAGRAVPFRVAQTTLMGAPVNGNRIWHGDATGTRWVHHDLVEPA